MLPSLTPNLARTLLSEFGKTRTSYATLVPSIIEVMRMYKECPDNCPIPIITKLDDLLKESELARIECQYPQSVENGFLVLCTERRALKSGGGGKYYFMDINNRLIGCPKSDLAKHAEKGVLISGPALLKNLIFVFIMSGADGLGCKSSNPKRLLEFFEAMSRQGSLSEIRYLLRVWSMEVHADYTDFPPCSLLWIKQMHVESHVQKWRDSQLQNHQRYAVRVAASVLNEAGLQSAMRMYSKRYLGEDQRKDCNDCSSFSDQHINANLSEEFDATMLPAQPSMPNLNEWITSYNFPFDSCEMLYQYFADIVPYLSNSQILEWSLFIIDKLNDCILSAAGELVAMTLGIEMPANEDREANKNGLCTLVCQEKEKNTIADVLRILLACLVQQNRIEQMMPSREESAQLPQQMDDKENSFLAAAPNGSYQEIASPNSQAFFPFYDALGSGQSYWVDKALCYQDAPQLPATQQPATPVRPGRREAASHQAICYEEIDVQKSFPRAARENSCNSIAAAKVSETSTEASPESTRP